MSLPATVKVKLSSEAAGTISITRVVVQDLPLRDLVEYMLGITGKDEVRVCELLLRGALVSGASRFRWNGWEADPGSIRDLLASFPDPEPARPFAPERCVRVVLRGGRQIVDISREAGDRKPLLRKTSFWDLLMQVAAEASPTYLHYSYKDRADCYRLELSVAAADKLRAGAEMIRFTTLREQIRSVGFVWAELYAERGAFIPSAASAVHPPLPPE
jgi:hypothetical protein